MLFNSAEFIFLFLPVTLILFYLLARLTTAKVAIIWLITASLFFYGWWKPVYLILIAASIVGNYAFGKLLVRTVPSGIAKRLLLIAGVTANLAALGYFKYANFFIDNINSAFGTSWHLDTIILPLAISFFTFQQIAYLVDHYRGHTRDAYFREYALFVTFFPQLVAGPIVHHQNMLPQFRNKRFGSFLHHNLVIGLAIFSIGLFKKTIIADGVAPYANTVFETAGQGGVIYLLEAWTGALAYTLQLYFDFSGYSDMAIGLARMFGIILPLNFYSPYKAASIIEFWRRWHMTLSNFLRDYLYFSLGGNRGGKVRRYINLMLTMLIGGLWHGAAWNFVLWGGLHGLFLIVNHAWNTLNQHFQLLKSQNLIRTFAARSMTLVCVIVAWVFFRATSVAEANQIISGMFGFNGMRLPQSFFGIEIPATVLTAAVRTSADDPGILGQAVPLAADAAYLIDYSFPAGVNALEALALLLPFLLIALLLPNIYQIFEAGNLSPSGREGTAQMSENPPWKLNAIWAIAIGLIAAYAVFGATSASEFLYFNF